jgi:hypothetical protein
VAESLGRMKAAAAAAAVAAVAAADRQAEPHLFASVPERMHNYLPFAVPGVLKGAGFDILEFSL